MKKSVLFFLVLSLSANCFLSGCAYYVPLPCNNYSHSSSYYYDSPYSVGYQNYLIEEEIRFWSTLGTIAAAGTVGYFIGRAYKDRDKHYGSCGKKWKRNYNRHDYCW